MKINLDTIEKDEQTKQYIEKYNLKIREIINLFDFNNMVIYADESERFKFLHQDLYITYNNKITKKYNADYIEELTAFLILRDDNRIELDLTSIA